MERGMGGGVVIPVCAPVTVLCPPLPSFALLFSKLHSDRISNCDALNITRFEAKSSAPHEEVGDI